jgi:hypothetical protein
MKGAASTASNGSLHRFFTVTALPPDVRRWLCRLMCGGGSAPPVGRNIQMGLRPWCGLCPMNQLKTPNDFRQLSATSSGRARTRGAAQ